MTLHQSNPRPAVFFDRDGTLIRHVHYLSRPDQVELLPGAASALITLRNAGFACVIVTNQAAIARGLLSEAGLTAIHTEMNRQLAKSGAMIDGIYHCPLAGICGDPTVVEFPDRKPGPGMLLRAAREMNLDLAKSWMVGDSIGDILAGNNAGCRGSIWIAPRANMPTAPGQTTFTRAKHLNQAARFIISSSCNSPTPPG